MGRFFYKHGNIILSIVGAIAALGVVLLIGNNVLENRANQKYEQENEMVYTTTTTTAAQPEETIDKVELEIPGGYNYISYSAINGISHSINTAALYTWCGKKDFTSIKGDVQITADGKLVMCHDEGFTLNEEGKIVLYDSSDAVAIRDLTEAECLNLRHAGTNSPICSFEEYIKICKEYDKIAYITVRDKYTDELIPEMVRILQQYEMVDRCIVNSFTYATLKAVRAAAPSVVLSYVLPYKTGITVDNIDDAVDLGNCLVCGFNFSAGSTVEDVKEIIDTSVVQYAQEKGVPLYEAQVHSMEIANELEKYGYSGAQMMKAPTVD